VRAHLRRQTRSVSAWFPGAKPRSRSPRPSLVFLARWHVAEPNQIDLVATAVLGHLEQVEDSQKTRCPRQFRCDVREANRLDRVHLDLAFVHPVTAAQSNVRPRPDSNPALISPRRIPSRRRFATSIRKKELASCQFWLVWRL